MKSLYRHKRSGDVFAIETNEAGQVVSTSGPLFGDDFDPNKVSAHTADRILTSA